MECGGVAAAPDGGQSEGDDGSRLSVSEDSGLLQEVELLQAIYMEDLTVDYSVSGHPESIEIQLNPATGDDINQRFVCLTLEFNLPGDYPDTVPDMVIRNPRGLADDHVSDLRERLRETADQRAGMPMLYELIELVKESLTQSNVPHGQCVICLEFFAEGEPFTRTACYHYLHCGCLLRYVKHCQDEHSREQEEIRQHKHMTLEKKQVVCPVCRDPISYDLDSLQQQASQAPQIEARITLSAEVRKLQRQMAALFKKQQAKGGIIDVEAERNKFLIPSEDQFVASPPEGVPSVQDTNPEVSLTEPLQLPSHRGQGRGRGTMTTNKQTEPHWKDRRQRGDHRDRRGHGRDRRKEDRVRTGRGQERTTRKPERDGREQRAYSERHDHHVRREAQDDDTVRISWHGQPGRPRELHVGVADPTGGQDRDRTSWHGQPGRPARELYVGVADPAGGQERDRTSWHGQPGRSGRELHVGVADPAGGQDRDSRDPPKGVTGKDAWKQEIHFVHSENSERRVTNGNELSSVGGLREHQEEYRPRGYGNRRDGGRWGGRGRGQLHSDHHKPRSGYENNTNDAKQLVSEPGIGNHGNHTDKVSNQPMPQDWRKRSDNRRREPCFPRPPPGFRNDGKSSNLHDSSANSHDSGESYHKKYYPPPPHSRRPAVPPPGFSSHRGQRSQPPPGFEERR